MAVGCSGAESTDSVPHPAAIVPDHASAAQPVEVVIQGTGFLARVEQSSHGGAPKLVTTHRAWLEDVELVDVSWVDAQTLRATIPAGIPVGPHTLTVQNALGERGSLENAYTAVNSGGLAGSLSSDRPSAAVGQQFTLTLTLRNAGDGDLTSITCSTPVITTTDGGGARPVGVSPTPPTSIPAHDERSVAWAFEATSVGNIVLTVTATAFDALTGRTLNADLSGPAQVLIQPAGTPPPPAAPTGLAATAVSQTRIDLAWGTVSGATGYLVRRGTASGGPYAQIATTTTPGYSDTSVAAATTYYYVVQATNAGGASPSSAEASATTPAPPPTAPAAPTGVTATARSQTRIDLTWTAASGATGYQILRGNTSGGAYAQIGTAPSSSYTDTAGLVAATTYYYVVRATSAGGTSTNSAEASATTLPPPAPPRPTGLTATAMSQTRIDLAWGSATGATGYTVLRGTASGGPYTQVATTTTPGYSDTSVAAATTYYYVVQATNAGGASPNSAEASATTPAPPPTAPAAPTGVIATAVSQARIDVAWNSVAGATSYDVLRGTAAGGPYARIGTTTGTSFSDTTGLAALTTYFYVVQATSAGGSSPYSAEVSATTLPLPPPPAPTGLAATAVSQTRIDLAWNAVSGATGYAVLRGAISGGPYALVGTSTLPSYSDTAGLTAGNTYYYVVQATNAGGTSGNSSQVSATTVAATLPAPAGLTASAAAKLHINLSWSAVTGATSYIVFRGQSSGGPYTQIGTATTRTYDDKSNLRAGTTYYYVVRATNGTTTSADSNQASATARQ